MINGVHDQQDRPLADRRPFKCTPSEQQTIISCAQYQILSDRLCGLTNMRPLTAMAEVFMAAKKKVAETDSEK